MPTVVPFLLLPDFSLQGPIHLLCLIFDEKTFGRTKYKKFDHFGPVSFF
jgi:hypothetical protein